MSTSSRSSTSEENGPCAEALPRGDRVADQDQQLGQRSQQRGQRPDRRGDEHADPVRVLAAQRAWADPDQHVGHH